MTDAGLKARLMKSNASDSDEDLVQEPQEPISPLLSSATNVMIAYQNANKWLDIVKETLLMDCGCTFFSNYIHNLAHSMPVRFDKFGDILHTMDMKVPYPATEYIESEPTSIAEAFDSVFSILLDISNALVEFIAAAESTDKAAAISAETLLEEIANENTSLYRMRRAYLLCGDNIKFDKWCAQYINNLGTLID